MATIKELLDEHNKLAAKCKYERIGCWKKSKAELVSRVAKLRRCERENEGQLSRLTIREIAEEALLEVATEDSDGNRLGHPYEAVLQRVLRFFPNAETTHRSLAWYASKMRGAGMMVPYRPRAKSQS